MSLSDPITGSTGVLLRSSFEWMQSGSSGSSVIRDGAPREEEQEEGKEENEGGAFTGYRIMIKDGVAFNICDV